MQAVPYVLVAMSPYSSVACGICSSQHALSHPGPSTVGLVGPGSMLARRGSQDSQCGRWRWGQTWDPALKGSGSSSMAKEKGWLQGLVVATELQ